ncbi:odorant receptor 4-like isoform X1 [Vespula maculifrons]|uniref:Odorant receptor 4-like isoform X1 n=1 Tax=Vespula maculifrons TaxID=7453 RepID=A0ABD2BPH0_VESMC
MPFYVLFIFGPISSEQFFPNMMILEDKFIIQYFPKIELGIANVRRSFNWSSSLLKCMGIWPLKNYDPIFLFYFTYLFLHCSLAYAQMFLSPKTIDDVLLNIAENIPLTMTLTKVMIIRVNRKALSKLFTEIKEYSLTEKYETKEEKMTFLNYTKLPPRFIAITVCSMTMSDILYYTNGLFFGIQIVKENNSMGYQLPYRTLDVDIRDIRIYALICVYQITYIASILFGYVGFDCMFVNLSIQVIAQFAILSYKVKTELNYSKNYHEGMKKLVLRHYRLIRLTEELEDNFNIPIMQQLLGTTLHICICGYYVLMISSDVQWDICQLEFVANRFMNQNLD